MGLTATIAVSVRPSGEETSTVNEYDTPNDMVPEGTLTTDVFSATENPHGAP